MTIYGVTGMPLAGKTTVAEIMEDEGFGVLDMGDIVRIEMRKRDVDPESTGDFVSGLRNEHGMDAIAQLCSPYLEEMSEEKEDIVITGMRGWDEKERFEKETDKEIEIIAVWASRETRRKRREERGRPEDTEGQEFHERDLRELDHGIGDLMALSDHLIKNEDGMETLERKVKQLVGE
jgi:dephospho-CoA kinase